MAIAILSSLYTGAQAFRQVHELSTGKQLIKPRMAAFIDFFGDQVCYVIHFSFITFISIWCYIFLNMTMIVLLVSDVCINQSNVLNALNSLKTNVLIRVQLI